MAEFSMDLIYRNKEWEASCGWTDGEPSMYGFNRRLDLKATGKKPETAIEALVLLVNTLLEETEKRIREESAAFEL